MTRTKLSHTHLCALVLLLAAFSLTHRQVSAATIFVSTGQDTAPQNAIAGCSLREAVTAINSQSNGNGCTNVGSPYGTNDTIRFNVNAITLSATVNPLLSVALSIQRPMLIMGNGLAVTTISGSGNPQTLFQNTSSNFTIQNIHIRGARVGVQNLPDASATLFQMRLSTFVRRAVINNGNMRITEVTININPGGGVTSGNQTPVPNLPDLSCLLNQSCPDFPVGHRPAEITITGSSIMNNGPAECAGIRNGGGLVQTGLQQEKIEGALTLSRSRVVGNAAGNFIGGGICNQSVAQITQSEISINQAQRGGGIAILGLQQLGINLFNLRPSTRIMNSTISGNTAATRGGGIFVEASGGNLTVQFSTIASNRSQGLGNLDAGGIASDSPRPAAFATTVLANNTSAATAAAVQNCANVQIQGNFNFFRADQGSCSLAGVNNITNIGNPALGTLTGNGSPRRSHMPATFSSLVERIPTNNGFCAGVDQRGRSRPRNGNALPGIGCDIGAIERP